MLSLGSRDMCDERLFSDLAHTRPRSLLLLEDVDAVFRERRPEDDNRSGVTFSGLLNAIDGVATQENRILVMTTNHYERLDPALIRPGRVDVEQYIGPADAMQARRLFLRFYPGEEELARQFGCAAVGVPPARLQGLLLSACNSAGRRGPQRSA